MYSFFYKEAEIIYIRVNQLHPVKRLNLGCPMKNCLRYALLNLSVISALCFFACGDDSASNANDNANDSKGTEIPCDSANEGLVIKPVDSENFRECSDGKWVEMISSSSGEKQVASSSDSVANSSSSGAQVASSSSEKSVKSSSSEKQAALSSSSVKSSSSSESRTASSSSDAPTSSSSSETPKSSSSDEETEISSSSEKMYLCDDGVTYVLNLDNCEKVKSSSSSNTSPSSSSLSSSSQAQSSATVSSSSSAPESSSEMMSSAEVDSSTFSIRDAVLATGTQYLIAPKVVIHELNASLNKTGIQHQSTNANSTSYIGIFGNKYYSESDTIAQQSIYMLIECQGNFFELDSQKTTTDSLTLNAIVDASYLDRKTINKRVEYIARVNLFTHIQSKRIAYLVKNGLDFPSAREQANNEWIKSLGLEGTFTEPQDIAPKTAADTVLYNVTLMFNGLTNSAAALQKLIDEVADDFEKDGVWSDSIKAKMADFARAGSILSQTTFKTSVTSTSYAAPYKSAFLGNFWRREYGIGTCTKERAGEIAAVTNQYSNLYYKNTYSRFICRDSSNSVFWRFATSYEKDLNNETTCDETGKIIKGAVVDTINYYCASNGRWVDMTNNWSWLVPKEYRFNPDFEYGTMTDERDGKVYRTTVIDGVTWMAENLNFADKNISHNLEGNMWTNKNAPDGEIAGRYYTWSAAMDTAAYDCGEGLRCSISDVNRKGICPEGWHIPRLEEWKNLLSTIEELGNRQKILRSKTGWDRSNNGTDAIGFSAFPVGYNQGGSFYGDGYYAVFWTATQGGDGYTSGYYFYISNSNGAASYGTLNKGRGHPVRCVKN